MSKFREFCSKVLGAKPGGSNAPASAGPATVAKQPHSPHATTKQPGTLRRLTSGQWRLGSVSPLRVQGGREMYFYVRNTGNHIGELTISAHDGQTRIQSIPSWGSSAFSFSTEGTEPIDWVFTPSIVGPQAEFRWELRSSWIP